MKFILRGPFKENVYSLMRKVGYHLRERQRSVEMNEVHRLQKKDEEKGELIFVKPPKGYPRFHLYLKTENGDLIFNLHLDQKRPIYKGAPAHSGEHRGEVVEKEAERIRKIWNKFNLKI